MASSFTYSGPNVAEMTPEKILECTLEEIQTKCGLSLRKCQQLKRDAASKVLKAQFLPLNRLPLLSKLTTGCSKIDFLLGGGLCSRGINELSGASACGKTQFCLKLCLTAQWPKSLGGFEAGVLYISTEGRFPSKRLNQLAARIASRTDLPKEVTSLPYSDNVFVRQIGEKEDLTKCLSDGAALMAARPVRLIIVDSIAGVFRTDLDAGAGERAKSLRAVVRQMEILSGKFDAAILCVNQVADVVSEGGGSQQVPALGLSWANLLRTRMWMSRTGDKRFLEVGFSPEVPSGVKLQFEISNDGLSGV
ncbi:DNA repair protein XRCC3-like isoform X1 [Neocloeon triangulifer]|uniref:DNA repair protein XRCC3-like isoform X1 n=1 Tax=Neocloeon triangulifer TaxID=2078957 RepID=UPI00286EF057|nr:DNA repair protein XRCC3-like isoform X1 [Neocloeon triangulifer]